jgi:glycine/serine hydroxymethyltransferase
LDVVGVLIGRVLAAPDDDRVAGMVKQEVDRLCREFPLYNH